MRPSQIALLTNGVIWSVFAIKAMVQGHMVALLFAGLAALTLATIDLRADKKVSP